MKSQPILVDASLTGGRGPAKQTYELVTDLRAANIPYAVISDRLFARKLIDIGVNPNYVVDTDLTEDPSMVIDKFYQAIKDIDFGLLVKLGARLAGPIAARKLGRPYLLADGGLPDRLSEQEDLFDRKTFEQAVRVYLTTQFPWQLPLKYSLRNVEVCCYPISRQSFGTLKQLKSQSKHQLIDSVKDKLQGELPQRKQDLFINLVLTGDIFSLPNRVTYGGWLTARQYDQSVGFVRRLLIDLASFRSRPSFVFLDNLVADVAKDVVEINKNLKIITYKRDWDFITELKLQAAADITISRATNYQPYIAALGKGASVTTPVPADGYMDEDSAGVQYQDLGLTKLIAYDDEHYVEKLLSFASNPAEQASIAQNLERNYQFLIDRNLSRIVIDYWKQ